MPYKKLLEEFPLYKKHKYDNGNWPLQSVAKPAIHMWCESCASGQTFSMTNNYYEGHPGDSFSNMAACHCRYLCSSCGEVERHFWIQFGPKSEWVMKVGQFPAWEITPDAVLEKTLGNARSQLYKRGLVCESQSYGIGAFAYYRRVVEEIINELLDEITDLIPEAEKHAYQEALAKTKKTRVTQDKIDLVKDLLPPILRPDGMNPLGVLHSALSEGLHGESDEHCLELAEQIREILVFLVNQVSATRTSAKNFTDAMRKLLDKKSS